MLPNLRYQYTHKSQYYKNLFTIIGDICKPCECNGNINVTDPGACDNVTGVCEICLNDTEGDSCEQCQNWFYGDAIVRKDCQGNK